MSDAYSKKKNPDAVRMAPVKPVDLFALEGAAVGDLRSAIEAMAGIAGMHLTPGHLDALSTIQPAAAAKIVSDLIAAAQAQKALPENSTVETVTTSSTNDTKTNGLEPVDEDA